MKKKTSEVEWRTDLNDTQQKIIKLLSEDIHILIIAIKNLYQRVRNG